MKLEYVVNKILRTGGISLTASGEFKGQTGYIVGASSTYHERLSDALLALQNGVDAVAAMGPTVHTVTVGVYRMNDGRYSVDVGLHLPGREVAEALGMALDQESIFDVAAMDCIPTGGKGGEGVSLDVVWDLANTNEAQLMVHGGIMLAERELMA